MDEESLTLAVFVPITMAILFGAICVRLMLRRWRHPRFFILWLLGMHLLTYPLFLGLLWLLYGMPPVFAMTLGEATIVLVEGSLIYLICKFISSHQSPLPMPTLSKSLFTSFIGNICSAVTFSLLMGIYGRIAYALMFSNMD